MLLRIHGTHLGGVGLLLGTSRALRLLRPLRATRTTLLSPLRTSLLRSTRHLLLLLLLLVLLGHKLEPVRCIVWVHGRVLTHTRL